MKARLPTACMLWLLAAPPGWALDQAQVHAHHDDDRVQPTAVSPAPASLPAPTAQERAAAFPPELEGMDMSTHMDDDPWLASLRVDRLEHGRAGDAWELRAGVGRTFDKFWLDSEGEREDGRTGARRTELAWHHATGPWWDRTLGLRIDDGRGGPARQWLAVGVAGLAPYKFEIAATAYVGTGGRTAARFEGEYELRLTHRLVLQPRLEANAYGRADPANGLDSGLSDAEFGLRLRFEVSPRFAPYIGHAWRRSFGESAGFAHTRADPVRAGQWLVGVRGWF